MTACVYLKTFYQTCTNIVFDVHSTGEYQQNQCDPKDSTCQPCTERLPDCINKPDGQEVFPRKLWQADYIICVKNRTISVDQCGSLEYFNPRLLKCMKHVKPGIFCVGCNDIHIPVYFIYCSRSIHYTLQT